MTADTLASERREGTLGLLLLTPLRPSAVVTGKMSVYLLRAFSLWFSILPVLVLPLILGGVGAADIGISLSFELSLVLVGLTAGVVWSLLARPRGAARRAGGGGLVSSLCH